MEGRQHHQHVLMCSQGVTEQTTPVVINHPAVTVSNVTTLLPSRVQRSVGRHPAIAAVTRLTVRLKGVQLYYNGSTKFWLCLNTTTTQPQGM